MYDTYMSTPVNTAKLGATHSNIQTAQSNPSLVGSEPAMHLSAYYTESAFYPLCQPGTANNRSNPMRISHSPQLLRQSLVGIPKNEMHLGENS